MALSPDQGRRRPVSPNKSWNPVTGCPHLCTYCWAMKLLEGKLKDSPKYRNGFKPTFHPEELLKARFRPGDTVFVVDMGDLFSDAMPREWVEAVLRRAREFPSTRFMFLTKNPARYSEFLDVLPRNSVLGVTIETNRDDLARSVSRAPPPSRRHEAMSELRWPYKYISVEPLMDFDLEVMVSWAADIRPVSAHVGYDNWNSRLPEPPLWKARELVRRLSAITYVSVGSMREPWYETLLRRRAEGLGSP
ncbi:DUF5131 family protein [Acidilobus sp. 7A]|jgi:hypothetical protein|uniref:DUF5131 family protein n=1 Tax=Acidilobus sp. 7A TaxID=1577685 RepID=UPI000764E620|nr:DUF5131 family protein [Acidilobus sp. 7A]AMD30656.1 hypothetical protein SE86_04190 [Acidilobus sp. 7A]